MFRTKREQQRNILFCFILSAAFPRILGVGKVLTNPDFHIRRIENSAYIVESITPYNPEIRATLILKIFSWFEGVLSYYFSVICVKPTFQIHQILEHHNKICFQRIEKILAPRATRFDCKY